MKNKLTHAKYPQEIMFQMVEDFIYVFDRNPNAEDLKQCNPTGLSTLAWIKSEITK